MFPLRIMCDLDGVVYPFTEQLRRILVAVYGYDRATLPTAETWEFYKDQWGMSTKTFLKICGEAVNERLLFREGLPILGAASSIHWLKLKGHTIHFVTDRTFGSRSEENTVEWLRAWNIPYDSLTFTADKSIVDADLYIDDRDANVWKLREKGKWAVVFDQPWNQQVSNPRMYGWYDLDRILLGGPE